MVTVTEVVTVTKCEKLKDWTSKQGQAVPIYKVTLSDGTEGQSFGKEIPIGTGAESIEQTTDTYGTKFKLKGSVNSFGGFKQQRAGNESFALSYAKDLCVADKVKIEQLLPTADKLYNWLESKKKI